MIPLFVVSTDNKSGGPVHHITWSALPIPRAWYDDAVTWINTMHDYSIGQTEGLVKLCENLNARHGANVAMLQLISIRNVTVKHKIIKSYGRMNARIGRITKEYATTDILTLSRKHDFPPLSLLRGIFLQRYSARNIYGVFAARDPPESLLHGRDLAQFKLADANDAESAIHQRQIAERAAAAEAAFVAFFVAQGIGLTTQDALTVEQEAQYGRAVLTPDILFTDEVYINGARVYWIDYKDYIGTDKTFLHVSNSAQAAKYHAKWGPGGLAYRRSYIAGVVIPHAQMLDVGTLDIDFGNNGAPSA